MSLVRKIEHIKESEIFKLVFDGKVLGLRTKMASLSDDSFSYHDFTLEMVEDKALQDFVKHIQKDMRSIKLYRDGAGLLVSEDEVKNKLTVQEFETPEAVYKELSIMREIYERKRGV